MMCAVCGLSLPDTPVFPGGSVVCSCGTPASIPLAAPPASLAPPVSSEPYREPLCPRCRAPLELREQDGVVVTACPAHHGVFVARPALEALEHESFATVRGLDDDAANSQQSSLAVAPCPRCDRGMRPRTLESGVVVDVCDLHGTWFDAGELSASAGPL